LRIGFAHPVESIVRRPAHGPPIFALVRNDAGATDAARAQPIQSHDVRSTDVFLRRLRGTLGTASEAGPDGYEDLLLTPGMGARSVAALALVGEVVHGAPARFEDPARFSFAHGGKHGHPYPVPLKVYDETRPAASPFLKRFL
jgi:uncharacterized protein